MKKGQRHAVRRWRHRGMETCSALYMAANRRVAMLWSSSRRGCRAGDGRSERAMHPGTAAEERRM